METRSPVEQKQLKKISDGWQTYYRNTRVRTMLHEQIPNELHRFLGSLTFRSIERSSIEGFAKDTQEIMYLICTAEVAGVVREFRLKRKKMVITWNVAGVEKKMELVEYDNANPWSYENKPIMTLFPETKCLRKYEQFIQKVFVDYRLADRIESM